MMKMIPLKLKCKNCGSDLSDTDKLIDGFPGVLLKIRVERGSGDIWLSSLYGSYNLECTLSLREGEIGTFSCPHCKMLMPDGRTCEKCNSSMVVIGLRHDHGDVHICRRKGCRNHYLEFKDFDNMKEFYDLYSDYFKTDV